jgi:hypothetical protein
MAARIHAAAVLLPSRLIALAATAAIALAACGSAVPTPAPSSTSSPSVPGATASNSPAVPSVVPSASAVPTSSQGADQGASLLLEARHVGGFINPAATIGAPSALVVDTDGRIYTPHVGADGTTPMIPTIDVRDTGAAGVTAVLAAARDAGLATGGNSGVVGDSGSTVFTLVNPDGAEVVSRVGMVGPGGPGAPGGSGGSSSAPGAAALALLARLTDPATPWPASAAPAKTFEPTAYEVFVAPEAAGGVGAATGNWPLAADPNLFGKPGAANLGIADLRSGTVTGDQATTLAKALAAMAAGSDLIYQGHAYRLWVRPMLPDELG